MRGTQRRRHGADPNFERRPDRRVVEIGVVAKEDRNSLALRQQRDRCAQVGILANRVAVRGRLDPLRRGFRQTTPPRAERFVHDDPPHPSLERAAPAEALPPVNRARKPFLNRVEGQPAVADYRDRDAQEALEPLAIEGLESVEAMVASVQRGKDAARTPFV